MQVTEISAQGLKREYKVVLPAADLASKLDSELADMRSKANIKGFRPGKVPTAHLRRLYGKSLMGEVVQNAVNEANRKIVEDHKLRLALEPKIDLSSDQAELEKALEAKGDLAFTVAVETLPQFEVGSFDDIELEKQVVDIDEADIEKSVARMADQNRAYEPKTAEDAVAEKGDKLTIDFEGRMGDELFDGGAGTDVDLVLGSDSFIPGFEDQLLGAKIGEHRKVEVKFPDQYLSPKLAGQEATFDVTVKAIAAPGEVATDDEFAKSFGFDDLDALKGAIRDRLKDDLSKASRDKLKRSLLDVLDKRYSFDLPEGLVNQEFEQIWRQVEQEQTQSGRTFADEKTTEDEQKAEYRKIAERRVRLGLVLADVGEKAAVKVEDAELGKALSEMVRQYPGQEKEVWEFYRKNPQALAQVRAPLFEEKVVDLIIAQTKVHERTVSRDELMKVEDDASATKSSDGATGDKEMESATE
ncbi:trigger factor [Lichenifustis flavocetrariae]|uniref:Trigger factor n=1 Tax=Lichenifustis flavocetrariae TaxID=2949735 RepID=A0AA41YTT2_9HYPH|nr:trigger factor [Lichenifustis flavocetrariae]MCW6507091.1 trigger factor [Lichenifustis flavocetrariae]